jgi:hypothetical protein
MTASLEHKQRMLAHQQAQQVKMLGENVVYRDALRALQAQLIPIRAMPAVRRALVLIDETLNPKDDLENQEATSEQK